MDSSTARLPNRLATAVEGAAAPMAMFMDAPTCSHAPSDKLHNIAQQHVLLQVVLIVKGPLQAGFASAVSTAAGSLPCL